MCLQSVLDDQLHIVGLIFVDSVQLFCSLRKSSLEMYSIVGVKHSRCSKSVSYEAQLIYFSDFPMTVSGFLLRSQIQFCLAFCFPELCSWCDDWCC